jgi:hypothetical protein
MNIEERECGRLIHVVINLAFQEVSNSHSVKWSEMDPSSQTMGQIETGGGSWEWLYSTGSFSVDQSSVVDSSEERKEIRQTCY